VAPLALVVSFDFQALLSFDRLQARITSTKSRLFDQALHGLLEMTMVTLGIEASAI
jgi:hypothetical protein